MFRKSARILFLIALTLVWAAPIFAVTYTCSMFPVVGQDVLDKDRQIKEPSGITYHPAKKSLFVVSDDDFIFETDLEAVVKRSAKLTLPGSLKLDLEDVAVNTRTGVLYVLSEKLDAVLEVNPDNFEVKRVFTYPQKFGTKTIYEKHPKDNGPEGLAFMPGKKPEEDVIIVCNQDDPPNVIKMKAPAPSDKQDLTPVKLTVISVTTMPVKDLSAAAFCTERGTLFVVSDFNNVAFELTRDCKIIRSWALPGDEQEGIIFVNNCLYIAQDTGKILRCKLDRNFFRKAE
ncbi:MAG: SdiA-regulated domain-containing protein [Firmicutes bacterium]|nr:SdiA-regulated domain-containing protein [Bacillota bacterium]